jgi:hypothetical protein
MFIGYYRKAGSEVAPSCHPEPSEESPGRTDEAWQDGGAAQTEDHGDPSVRFADIGIT